MMDAKVLSPLKAIRAYCLWCCCDSWLFVKECSDTDCPLYHLRLGHRPKEKGYTPPVKSIRARCIQCSDTVYEVKKCESTDCPLFPYRLGKNPNCKNFSGNASNLALWREKQKAGENKANATNDEIQADSLELTEK